MDQRQQQILTQSVLAAGVTLAVGLVGLGFMADPSNPPETAVLAPESLPGTALEPPAASGGMLAARPEATTSPPAAGEPQVDGSGPGIQDVRKVSEARSHEEEEHEDEDDDEEERSREARGRR